MEDEGIMALPEGQATQEQAPAKKPVYISSADAYDAALQGLGMSTNDPSQAAAVKQAVKDSIDELALSPKEVMALLDMLEYMSQHPEEYPQLRQQLLEADMMDPDDLPEEYDAAFLGMAIMVLNEYQSSRAEGAQAAMDMAPEVEGLGPMPMAEGGLADMARYLASYGQRGDTMLAHITPEEARLLKSIGGAGTLNPHTQLPQFFLKKLFKGVKKAVKKILANPIFRVVATVALATVIGPAAVSAVAGMTGATAVAAGTAGAAAGLGGTAYVLSTSAAAAATALSAVGTSAAISAMAGEKLNAKNLLVNAAASYFGAGGRIGQFAPLKMATDFAGRLPGITAGSKVAQSIGSALTSATVGRIAGLDSNQALAMGLQAGAGTYFSKLTKPLSGYSDQELKDLGYTEGQIQRIRAENTPPAKVSPSEGTSASSGGTAAENVPVKDPGAIGPATDYVDPYSQEGGIFARGGPGIQGTAPVGAPSAGTTPTGKAPPAAGGTSTASAYPTGLTTGQRFSRLLDSPNLENLTNFFLVNPNITEGIGRYIPAGLTLAGLGAVTGGYEEQPVDQNPLYDRSFTGAEFIRKNPGMFSGNLGRVEGMPAPFNPIVPTPNYARPPVTAAPTVIPRGITRSPTGVVQPYNVAGLYGVPELAAPVEQPVYMATGGTVSTLPTRQQRIDTMLQQFMRDNPNMTADQLRPMVEQRVDTIHGQNQGYYSTGAATTPATTIPPPAGSFSGISANFGQATPPAGFNPAVPTMPERTAVRRTRAQMTAPVVPIPPPLPKARLNHQNVPGLYGVPDLATSQPMFMNQGGQPTHFPRKTGQINGPGTGTSDSIPAMLSDGEFVFTARAVRNAGGGSRRKGAKRMYALMKKLEGGPVKKGDA